MQRNARGTSAPNSKGSTLGRIISARCSTERLNTCYFFLRLAGGCHPHYARSFDVLRTMGRPGGPRVFTFKFYVKLCFEGVLKGWKFVGEGSARGEWVPVPFTSKFSEDFLQVKIFMKKKNKETFGLRGKHFFS